MADKSPTRRPFIFPFWWILPLLALAGVALFGDKGVLRLWKGYQQREELQVKVAQLREDNQRLRQEINALKNDPRTIESLARRKLGMVRPDELVYQFTSPEKHSPKTDGTTPKQSPAALTPRSTER